MESVCRSENFALSSDGVGKVNPAALGSGAVLQTVKTSEILFQAGDDRTLYRVERGAICHYMLWADGRHDVIEFAFPGDIVGLGHLRKHVSTSQAMVDTVVSVISAEELEEVMEQDDRLSFRQSAAIEREFDHLRDQALAAKEPPAEQRVANFLLALSGMNGPEGRDTTLITDDITAGFVAEKLDLSIDKLGAALLSLKKRGAVKETPSGLKIVDAVALQKLANAA